jgi:ribosomal protein S18 acetylase RimI-like enzyme
MMVINRKLFTFPGYGITQLNTEDQVVLQTLLEKCSDYFILVTGSAPKSSAATSLLTDFPPGKTLGDKLVIGISLRKQGLIGVLDAVRDYPKQEDWWLGLLLLEPAHRKKGLGRQIVQSFEQWASQQGARRILLGVLEENTMAYRFWQSVGFEIVERQPARQIGNRTHRMITMAYTISEA